MRKHLVVMAVMALTTLTGAIAVPSLALATGEIAILQGCVYNKKTGKPIQNAGVFIQFLGSPPNDVVGSSTGADGCSKKIAIAASAFLGDYIEALVTYQGRIYREQYRIPYKFIQQTYHYDFFVDAPRAVEVSEGPFFGQATFP